MAADQPPSGAAGGQAAPGPDIAQLAEKVLHLLEADVRLERIRQGRRIPLRRG
jgi:hypothetical protein